MTWDVSDETVLDVRPQGPSAVRARLDAGHPRYMRSCPCQHRAAVEYKTRANGGFGADRFYLGQITLERLARKPAPTSISAKSINAKVGSAGTTAPHTGPV